MLNSYYNNLCFYDDLAIILNVALSLDWQSRDNANNVEVPALGVSNTMVFTAILVYFYKIFIKPVTDYKETFAADKNALRSS